MIEARPRAPALERLAIIIVNRDGWPLAATCARRLQADGPEGTTVVIVDNASRDGSVARLTRLFPAGVVHACAANLGFAGGCNLGADVALAAGAEALLFINPDTVAMPGFLGALARGARRCPDLAASPEIYHLSYPGRAWFAGAWRGAHPGLLRYRTAGAPRRSVDYLWACCLLVGADVWRRVGPFDTRYFLYYEDMDWCERAQRVGVRLSVIPEARLWHGHGAAAGGAHRDRARLDRRYHLARSGVLYDRRWGSALPAPGGWLRLAASLRTALRLAVRCDGRAFAAHVRGLCDGWRVDPRATLPEPS